MGADGFIMIGRGEESAEKENHLTPTLTYPSDDHKCQAVSENHSIHPVRLRVTLTSLCLKGIIICLNILTMPPTDEKSSDSKLARDSG